MIDKPQGPEFQLPRETVREHLRHVIQSAQIQIRDASDLDTPFLRDDVLNELVHIRNRAEAALAIVHEVRGDDLLEQTPADVAWRVRTLL